MFKDWLLENAYGIITTILSGGGLFAYWTERKKRKIQEQKDISSAKQEEASALETIQLVYDKFVKDSLDRYIDLIKQIDDIKKELQTVTRELEEEKHKNNLLQLAYENLKETCEALNLKMR